MKKSAFRGLLLALIFLFVLSAITAAAVIFDLHGRANIKNISTITLGAAKKAFERAEAEVEEEIPLTMSNVSTVVLTNKDVEERENQKRAGLLKFFFIPIDPGATLYITNNSDEFKYSVICFSENLIYDNTGSGWVMPKNATSYTPEPDKKYITVSIARVDEEDLDIAGVDLTDFSVFYSGENANLLDTLLPMAESYGKSKLKDYDSDELKELSKKDTVGHACGTDVHEEKATMAALKNAVETEGFKIVEIDVRETADHVLVCYHDEVMANTRLSVKGSAYAQLKGAKPDLSSLEELLSYCGANNVSVVLDVKEIHSEAGVISMFSLIERNGLQDKFFFAGCPQYLLDNMPKEYKSVSYSNYLSWNDSYNGQNNVRFSNGCSFRIDLIKLSNILKAGHRSFELYDLGKSISSSDTFIKDLSIFMYLCSVYDANYNLTLFNNITVPVLSEREIISSMPKSFWDSLDMICYEE